MEKRYIWVILDKKKRTYNHPSSMMKERKKLEIKFLAQKKLELFSFFRFGYLHSSLIYFLIHFLIHITKFNNNESLIRRSVINFSNCINILFFGNTQVHNLRGCKSNRMITKFHLYMKCMWRECKHAWQHQILILKSYKRIRLFLK